MCVSEILQKPRLEVNFLPPFCSFLGAMNIFHYFAKAVELKYFLTVNIGTVASKSDL